MGEWDVVVVGGGTAGLTAARSANLEGARVALIERAAALGGECTFVGCVPSKTIIEVSRIHWSLRQGARYGIHADGLRLDFAELMAHKDAVIADINRDERPELFAEAGIAVLRGNAKFTAPHEISVDGATHRFASAVIATGSDPLVPAGIGLEQVPHLTNANVFDLRALPKRLVVLGGGPIGLELGQAFSRLGSEVTVIHQGAQLLEKEEPEVGELMAQLLRAEGMYVHLATTATRVAQRDGGIVVSVVGEDGAIDIVGDQVLVATGRAPRVSGLGLEALGIEPEPAGVQVDRTLRTSVPHVFAAGDVTGQLLFTHVASYEGRIAGHNAVSRRRHKADYRVVPWVTFLDPEVARVGLTEADARARHRGVEVLRFPMSRVDRARMLGEPKGFIKLITARRRVVGRMGGGILVGAHIVGPHAGEIVHEAVLAMQANVFAGRLAQAIHAYPAAAVGMQQAASQLFPVGRALVEADDFAPTVRPTD